MVGDREARGIAWFSAILASFLAAPTGNNTRGTLVLQQAQLVTEALTTAMYRGHYSLESLLLPRLLER